MAITAAIRTRVISPAELISVSNLPKRSQPSEAGMPYVQLDTGLWCRLDAAAAADEEERGANDDCDDDQDDIEHESPFP